MLNFQTYPVSLLLRVEQRWQVMATCMAPPWPSQRRSGFNSERHTALARMRERQGSLEEFFEESNGKTRDLDMDPDSWGKTLVFTTN